jgi:hypothetical protein
MSFAETRYLSRLSRRLDDSLYMAAVISGASIFSWIVAVL